MQEYYNDEMEELSALGLQGRQLEVALQMGVEVEEAGDGSG